MLKKSLDVERIALMKVRAMAAKGYAYAPYSHFPVGAALLADDGHIYTGCNIENASFGATICAERAAISAAISAGAKKILCMAVIADTNNVITPCGICRQTIAEFANMDTVVYCGDRTGFFKAFTLKQLLPEAFTEAELSDGSNVGS